jgi:hypothetical protein
VRLNVDYKGLVDCIRRNPDISIVTGNVVHEKDVFIYREGSDRAFLHEPQFIEGDKVKGAYCFVKFRNSDDWQATYMPKWEIEGIRRRSASPDKGPWVTDYDQMAIKTAIRRQSKVLPLTEDARLAVTSDDFIDVEDMTRSEPKQFPQKPAAFKRVPVESFNDSEGDTSENGPELPEDPIVDPEPGNEAPLPPDEPAEDPAAKVREAFTKQFDKLQKLMVEKKITDAELLFALNDFGKDIGHSSESNVVSDLPFETVKDAVKSWASLEWEILKLRKSAAGEIKK